MYATGNKKMLNILILDILKEYTDQNHRVRQQDIIDLLKQNYGMACDRRTIRANIESLQEMGYDINYDNGYCLMEREFEDAELRLLIDAVLFSRHITNKQARDLISKLKKQASRFFQAKVSHVCNLPELPRGDNKQLMYVLDAVNEAISRKKKISFIYNEYGTDFKLHPRREEPYLVNPYQMVANNGRYYLIANYDKYDNISYFRLDKVTSVVILEDKVKNPREVKGMEHGLDLPKHMAEHIYMISGESVSARIRTGKKMMDVLVDWFSKDIQIVKEDEENIEIYVKCNETALMYWALQYGFHVEILEPESLRARIREAVNVLQGKYGE